MGFKSGSSASLKEIEAEQKKTIEKMESQEKDDALESAPTLHSNEPKRRAHTTSSSSDTIGGAKRLKSFSAMADDDEMNLVYQKEKIKKKQEELFEIHKKKFLIDNRRLLRERPDNLPPFVGELMDKLIEAGNLEKSKIESYRQYILREPVVSEKKLKERYLKMVDDCRNKGRESLNYLIEKNPDHWVYISDEDGIVSSKTIPKNESCEGLGLLHGTYIFVINHEKTPFSHPSELFKWNENANEREVEDVFERGDKDSSSLTASMDKNAASIVETAANSTLSKRQPAPIKEKDEGKKKRTLKNA